MIDTVLNTPLQRCIFSNYFLLKCALKHYLKGNSRNEIFVFIGFELISWWRPAFLIRIRSLLAYTSFFKRNICLCIEIYIYIKCINKYIDINIYIYIYNIDIYKYIIYITNIYIYIYIYVEKKAPPNKKRWASIHKMNQNWQD